jgi:hypothetical protein
MKVKTNVKAGQFSGITVSIGNAAGDDVDNRGGGAGILNIGNVFNP